MGNNSTIINKTYAYMYLSPQINELQKDHDKSYGNPDPGLGQAKRCDRVKLINGIPSWKLDLHIVLNFTVTMMYYNYNNQCMINNSTNINKANITSYLKSLNTRKTMKLEIQVLAWDRHKTVSGLNRFVQFYNDDCKILQCSKTHVYPTCI